MSYFVTSITIILLVYIFYIIFKDYNYIEHKNFNNLETTYQKVDLNTSNLHKYF